MFEAAFRLSRIPNFELGTAAMIYPDAVVVVSPTVAEPAGRLADLPRKLYSASCVRCTVLAGAEVGGAFQSAHIWGRVITVNRRLAPPCQREVGAAAVVHPNPATIVAPTITFAASRPAALSQHRRGACDVAVAIMSLAILGGAGKLHRFLVTVLRTSVTIEVVAIPIMISIRIPVMIPIATTPTLIPIVIAVVVAIAIMVAVDASDLRRIHQKICAAATINPNSLLIESPSLILNTSRLAVLSL